MKSDLPEWNFLVLTLAIAVGVAAGVFTALVLNEKYQQYQINQQLEELSKQLEFPVSVERKPTEKRPATPPLACVATEDKKNCYCINTDTHSPQVVAREACMLIASEPQ
jgi:hypothetical protein